jgi:hypothetical protein
MELERILTVINNERSRLLLIILRRSKNPAVIEKAKQLVEPLLQSYLRYKKETK